MLIGIPGNTQSQNSHLFINRRRSSVTFGRRDSTRRQRLRSAMLQRSRRSCPVLWLDDGSAGIEPPYVTSVGRQSGTLGQPRISILDPPSAWGCSPTRRLASLEPRDERRDVRLPPRLKLGGRRTVSYWVRSERDADRGALTGRVVTDMVHAVEESIPGEWDEAAAVEVVSNVVRHDGDARGRGMLVVHRDDGERRVVADRVELHAEELGRQPTDCEVPANRVALDRPRSITGASVNRDVPVDRRPSDEDQGCARGRDVPVDRYDGLIRVVNARDSR